MSDTISSEKMTVQAIGVWDIEDWLYSKNLREHIVAGDGHCIIHAAGLGLGVSSNRLLQQVLMEISNYESYYQEFVPSDVSFMDEIRRWAGEKCYQLQSVDLVLSAITNIRSCRIIIIEENDLGVAETTLQPGRKNRDAQETIYMIKRSDHYNSVDLPNVERDSQSSCEDELWQQPKRQKRSFGATASSSVEVSNPFAILISDDSACEEIPDSSDTSPVRPSRTLSPILISSSSESSPIKKTKVGSRMPYSSLEDKYKPLSSSSDETYDDPRSTITGSVTPMSLWKNTLVTTCEELPRDINGRSIHKLKYSVNDRQRMESSKDGRPWQKYFNSRRHGFFGVRRLAHCKGSMECINKDCIYFKQHSKQNTFYVSKDEFGSKVCMHCNCKLITKKCQAIKIWEFPENEKPYVYVYHDGIHTCTANMRTKPPAKELTQIFRQNPKTKPIQAVNELIRKSIHENKSWAEIEKLADSVIDNKSIRNIKQKALSELHPTGHSFEAIADLKSKTAEKDKFYVFRVNDGRLNDQPSYIFKSSTDRANIGIQMDCEDDKILKDEYCYVDFKSSRCKGFKTLGVYVYHKLLKKVIPLALMECENENQETVTLFWKTFNDMLGEVKGDKAYKFNPAGFMMDEGGGLWVGTINVFGEKTKSKMVSCIFHYKQSVNRHADKSWSHKSQVKFKQLATQLQEAVTPGCYERVHQAIVDFTNEKPQKRDKLKNWLKWWNDRRSHFCFAFRPLLNVPNTNLAECAHSAFVSKGCVNLSLVDAAYFDTVESIKLKQSLSALRDSTNVTGTGPTNTQRVAREFAAQKKRARAYCNEFGNEDTISNSDDRIHVSSEFRPNPTSLHRPTKPRKRSGRPSKAFSSVHDKLSDLSDSDSESDNVKVKNPKRPTRTRTARSITFLKSLKKSKEMKKSTQTRITQKSSNFVMLSLKHLGKEYTVLISRKPKCTCEFSLLHDHYVCKHVLYVLTDVFGLHEDSNLLVQKSFTDKELQDIISNLRQGEKGTSKQTSEDLMTTHCTPPAPSFPDPYPGSFSAALLQYCHANVQKCSGCGDFFKRNNSLPPDPHDLVVVTKMNRTYYDKQLQCHKQGPIANAYFHINEACVQRQLSLFIPSLIFVPDDLKSHLTPKHKILLQHLKVEF